MLQVCASLVILGFMSKARWAATDDALRVLVGLVRSSGVRSMALDCPIILKRDLVAGLQLGGLSRTAAYRLVDVAIDDGLLVWVDGVGSWLCEAQRRLSGV